MKVKEKGNSGSKKDVDGSNGTEYGGNSPTKKNWKTIQKRSTTERILNKGLGNHRSKYFLFEESKPPQSKVWEFSF